MEIVVDDISKAIHGAQILKNISMEMTSGKIYGLQGQNGSGKTMLMRALAGLIYCDSGKITVDGKVLGKDISFPESIGILIENPGFIAGETGYMNLKYLAMIRNRIDDQRIYETLQDVGLNPADKRKYRKYSLGMKQRLGIAAALMEDPDLLILDEPTNALDEDGVILLKELLAREKEKNKLMIISCHDKDILRQLSDEIYVLRRGSVEEHYIPERGETEA